MNWVTIDFEASCLPRHGRSFPIEVGVCAPSGTRSWLIKPQPEWRDWDWTEEAFLLHGITRDMLERDGQDPAIIMAELHRVIGDSRVISDSVIDRRWWQTLADAAGDAAPIEIEHVADIFDELGATADQIRLAQRRADAVCPERHRAGSDARWLFALLSGLPQRIAPESQDTARKPFPSWASRDAYVRRLSEPQTDRATIRQLGYTDGR